LPGSQGPNFVDRVKPILKPMVDEAWLNLQVWIPFLANPQLRARQVKYRARENRDGMEWSVKLPRQCWECGTKTAIKSRSYDKDIRTFEHGVSIIGVTLGCFMLLVLVGLVFRWVPPLVMAPLSLVVGGGVLFIKSWIERVELTMWTCDAHADAMRCPELVIEDELLVVHAANPVLADAAIEELRAERSKGPRYVSPETTKGPRPSETVPMNSSPAPSPAAGTGLGRQELPPIKLDAAPELVDPMMQADPVDGGHKIQFDEPIKFGESIKLDDKIRLDDDQPPPKAP
jgi:hypothetical protein